MVDAQPPDRTTKILVWLSFVAWAVGTIVPGYVLFLEDHPSHKSGGDVAAGLQGMAVAAAFAIFLLSTFVGVALGNAAARRAPDERLPAVAQGLNIITLFGVLVSILVQVVARTILRD
jgi:hypothetical protein